MRPFIIPTFHHSYMSILIIILTYSNQHSNISTRAARRPFSVGNFDKTLVGDDKQRGGVVVQAYSPLASGGVISDPDCIAIGKAHNKSSVSSAHAHNKTTYIIGRAIY